jgi:hypothetical protein
MVTEHCHLTKNKYSLKQVRNSKNFCSKKTKACILNKFNKNSRIPVIASTTAHDLGYISK